MLVIFENLSTGPYLFPLDSSFPLHGNGEGAGLESLLVLSLCKLHT